jgi:hypothetical protein
MLQCHADGIDQVADIRMRAGFEQNRGAAGTAISSISRVGPYYPGCPDHRSSGRKMPIGCCLRKTCLIAFRCPLAPSMGGIGRQKSLRSPVRPEQYRHGTHEKQAPY